MSKFRKPMHVKNPLVIPVKKIRLQGGLLFLSSLFFLLAQATSFANDLDNGEALHAQHCQSCHQSDIYIKAGRQVTDLSQLKQRVKQCELANDLLWFEEEVNDVSAYLNTHFYLFGIKTEPEYFSGLDSEAARVVSDFHRALQSGDESTVRLLLASNVVIFEAGSVERSAHEYTDHHMRADMDFLKEMRSTKLEHHVKVNGDTALSISRSKLQGRYKDKDIDIESMETLLLMKLQGKWQIVHIHWSS